VGDVIELPASIAALSRGWRSVMTDMVIIEFFVSVFLQAGCLIKRRGSNVTGFC